MKSQTLIFCVVLSLCVTIDIVSSQGDDGYVPVVEPPPTTTTEAPLCACTLEYAPVCGMDNKVYGNKCASINCGKGPGCCYRIQGFQTDGTSCPYPCPGPAYANCD